MAFVTRQHSGVVLELLAKAASAIDNFAPGPSPPRKKASGRGFWSFKGRCREQEPLGVKRAEVEHLSRARPRGISHVVLLRLPYSPLR